MGYSTWSPQIHEREQPTYSSDGFLGSFKKWIEWTNIVANYTMPAAYTAFSHHKLMRNAWRDYRQFIPHLDLPLNWRGKSYREWIWKKMGELMKWGEEEGKKNQRSQKIVQWNRSEQLRTQFQCVEANE